MIGTQKGKYICKEERVADAGIAKTRVLFHAEVMGGMKIFPVQDPKCHSR